MQKKILLTFLVTLVFNFIVAFLLAQTLQAFEFRGKLRDYSSYIENRFVTFFAISTIGDTYSSIQIDVQASGFQLVVALLGEGRDGRPIREVVHGERVRIQIPTRNLRGHLRLVVTSDIPYTTGNFSVSIIPSDLVSVERRMSSESASAFIERYLSLLDAESSPSPSFSQGPGQGGGRPSWSPVVPEGPIAVPEGPIVVPEGPIAVPPDLIPLGGRDKPPVEETTGRTPKWNAWLEDGAEIVQLDNVGAGRIYNFVLDLSAYSFGDFLPTTVASGEVSKPLAGHVLKEPSGKVKIRLRPIVTGAMWTDSPLKDVVLEIDRARFGKPSDDETTLYHQFKEKEIDLITFANEVRAAHVVSTMTYVPDNSPMKLEVRTDDAPGCGVVAFSVWDEFGTRPLDHLVFTIRVGEQSASPDECISDDKQTNVLVSGFKSLLAPAVGQKPFQDRKISAGLHIFEVGFKRNEIISIAVLVDGRNPNKLEVLDWQLDVPLSEVLRNEIPGLLEEAQLKASKDDDSEAYAFLARKIKDRLFFDVSEDQKAVAESGWKVLQSIAKEKGTLLTRLVDRDSNMIYLPLGLLHAGMSSKPLEGDLNVIQALPRSRYTNNEEKCVNNWSFILPEKLENDRGDSLKGANRDTNSSWIKQVIKAVDTALKSYLRHRSGENPLPDAPSEGLLMVAHQADGWMWFDSAAHRFAWADIKRPYAPGSVAILAACEAAGIDDKNRRVLDRLNSRGVDLIIAAPFQVRVGYAAPLAIELDQLIRDVYAEKDPNRDRRIVKLFNEAATKAHKEITDSMSDMRREFLILGDPDIKLCLPQQQEVIP